MAIEHPQMMTVEEYFQLEENDPDTRYEYSDGDTPRGLADQRLLVSPGAVTHLL